MKDKNISNVCEFEIEYGHNELVKLCLSVINKILVDKNIITEWELIETFQSEMKKWKK